jgi:hypothetical protein
MRIILKLLLGIALIELWILFDPSINKAKINGFFSIRKGSLVILSANSPNITQFFIINTKRRLVGNLT